MESARNQPKARGLRVTNNGGGKEMSMGENGEENGIRSIRENESQEELPIGSQRSL